MLNIFKKFFSSKIEVNLSFEKSEDFINLLKNFDYKGVVDPDVEGVRSIIDNIYWHDYEYVNLFKVAVNNNEFYFVDSKLKTSSIRNIRVNSIFIVNEISSYDFEVTDESCNLYAKNVKKLFQEKDIKVYAHSIENYNLNKGILNQVALYIENNKLLYPQYFVHLADLKLIMYYTQLYQYGIGNIVKKVLSISEISDICQLLYKIKEIK